MSADVSRSWSNWPSTGLSKLILLHWPAVFIRIVARSGGMPLLDFFWAASWTCNAWQKIWTTKVNSGLKLPCITGNRYHLCFAKMVSHTLNWKPLSSESARPHRLTHLFNLYIQFRFPFHKFLFSNSPAFPHPSRCIHLSIVEMCVRRERVVTAGLKLYFAHIDRLSANYWRMTECHH